MRNIVAGVFVVIAALAAADARAAERGSNAPCVDVEIGRDRATSLECLNADIQRRVEYERNAPTINAPLDARSPAHRVGVANEEAAHEKMGNSFGSSAQPQRPQRNFKSPLLP